MISNIAELRPFPGNNGKDCPFNGNHFDEKGNLIECGCDECSFMMCCFETHSPELCDRCNEYNCPHFLNKIKQNRSLKIDK